MDSSQYASIGKAIASDIRNVSVPALMLPIRKRDEKLLLLPWEQKMVAMMLTGPNAFLYFDVSLRSPHKGLLIPEIDVLVDLDSVTEGIGREDHRGVLILEQNQLSVIGLKASSSLGDGHRVPLWTEIHGGTSDSVVAFNRWAIGLKEGDTNRILWEFDCNQKAD